MKRATAIAAVLALVVLAACSSSGGGKEAGGGCTSVDVASSPEKFELLTQLASKFNDSSAAKKDGCATVKVQNKSSGAAADLVAAGWPDEGANGPKPVIWSPAAASWGAVVNQRRADQGQPPIAPVDAKPFQLTPLVIAGSLLLGAFAFWKLPREEEPQIIVPMVDVFVQMPGASAREVEERVTKPMEKLLWEIPGVEYIYSTSSPGTSTAIVAESLASINFCIAGWRS